METASAPGAETASLDSRAGEGYLEAPLERPVPRRDVVRIGVGAGLLAGAALIVSQMGVGEIASEPTAVEGIESSTWTAITSVASLLLGVEAFHGSLEVGSVLVGLIVILAYAVVLGIVGVAALVYVQGYDPPALPAAVQGATYALLVQVLVLNLAVNAAQDVNTVYLSTPSWGWWVGHAVYGVTFGVACARALARAPSPASAPDADTREP